MEVEFLFSARRKDITTSNRFALVPEVGVWKDESG
jgi:hypothetical protein